MKTRTPTLIIIILSLCCCTETIGQNDLTSKNIKGQVSVLTEYEYSVEVGKFGKIQKGSLISKQTYKYGDRGNLIERNTYSPDDRLYGKDTYRYDNRGNIIEVIEYSPDGRLNSEGTYKYDDYDKAGNWLRQESFYVGYIKESRQSWILVREIKYY